MEFRVPDMGEGIEQATVVRVLVQPGAAVRQGQDLVEVETEKATMPIQAEAAGTVEQLLVKPGDKVKVGTVILTLNGKQSEPQAASQEKPAKPRAAQEKPQAAPAKPQAASKVEFAIPDLGEGITGGTVVSVAVKAGDAVKAEQTLLELETEKATIPVPSPVAGTIDEVRVKPGQKIDVGAVVVVISAEQGAKPQAAPAKSQAAPARPQAAPKEPAKSQPAPSRNGDPRIPVPAAPATRRMARELGVDLRQVSGTAPGGRVTRDDVTSYLRHLPKSGAAPAAGAVVVPPLPDFAKYGVVERKPFSALRKAIARNLTVAWTVAPAVTQHDLADITELEASRKRFIESAPKGAPKVTMTVLAVKAVVAALKAFPHVNASYDPNAGENGELILKRYFNIGIAVDTERGLVVPVIRDADKKGVSDLAKELAELAEKARAGKLLPDDMRGGTFTITNLGGIGGTAFTPIINYPEVAILGLSRSSLQPVIHEGKIEPRLMLPLSLTYDHRVVDGADGARFITRLSAAFTEPMRLLFES
jgi:pyruvate dehydrogenase E2 component (dihydrolipoamide acetyltransferase)